MESFVMPFSHLDLFWLGAREQCLSRGNRIISEAIKIAKQNESFRFLLENIVFVNNFVESHPEKLEELKELVAAGKIELGAEWAGIHQNTPDGEELVRNTLYAKRYAMKVFSYEPKTVHLGDLPGYTPQYPQIMSKSSVPFVIQTRCGPQDAPLYHWKALDGSTVLTWNALKGYGWSWGTGLQESVETAKERKLEEQIREVASKTPAPILIHWGADLILPTKKLCNNVRAWNEQCDIKLSIITPTEYFEKVKNIKDLPVIEGEIPNCWSYSEAAFANITPLDVPATNLLLTAEKFATINFVSGYSNYPAERLEENWRKLMEALDHNYDGQGADEGDRRKEEYARRAILAAEEVIRDSLRNIAEKVEVRDKESYPIVVFNPLSWKRTDIVVAHVTFHGDISAFDIAKYRVIDLVDSQGKSVPFQVIDEREGVSREITITFVAEDVPSIGYKTYYVVPVEKEPPLQQACKVEEVAGEWWGRKVLVEKIACENEYYRITIDKFTGKVGIFDKELNRTTLEDARIVGLEEKIDNFFFRDFITGRVFENQIESVELVENGSVRARLKIRGKVLNSPTVQEIILYKKLKRIDIVNTVDWEGEKPIRIQQLFPLKVTEPDVNFGIPYGVTSFENLQPGSGPRYGDELPRETWLKLREVQRWIDVSNKESGVTIACDHRLVEVDGSLIKANMVRGTHTIFTVFIKDGKREFGWHSAPRRYTFKYSIRSHKEDWKSAEAYVDGWFLTNPLIPISVNDQETAKPLPPQKSFCSVSSRNVIVSALKKAEESNDVVLRFFETAGEPAKSQIGFFMPVKEAFETDLLEQETKRVENLEVEAKPFEIKTVKMKLADR